MSRELSSGVIANLEDDVVYPFFAVELQFDGDETLRLWTGYGTLVYQGVSWFGSGSLLNISAVEETTEMAAKGATITLSSVPSDIISLALTQPYQGRVCDIYFGLFQKNSKLTQEQDGDSYILLEGGAKILLESQETSLTKVFSGYMDQMNIEEGADVSTLQLSVENKLVDLERPRAARYTSAYQKSKYPTDKGFDFVEDLQDQKLVWGRKVE
tara:strand:+ start:87 stop:725 length:639 start_codon:yes stop_codon:yes gene_type:complete